MIRTSHAWLLELSEVERQRGMEKTFKTPKDSVKLEDMHKH